MTPDKPADLFLKALHQFLYQADFTPVSGDMRLCYGMRAWSLICNNLGLFALWTPMIKSLYFYNAAVYFPNPLQLIFLLVMSDRFMTDLFSAYKRFMNTYGHVMTRS